MLRNLKPKLAEYAAVTLVAFYATLSLSPYLLPQKPFVRRFERRTQTEHLATMHIDPETKTEIKIEEWERGDVKYTQNFFGHLSGNSQADKLTSQTFYVLSQVVHELNPFDNTFYASGRISREH